MLFAALRFPKIKGVIEGARANVDRARRLINSPRRLALTIAEHEVVVAAHRRRRSRSAPPPPCAPTSTR